jgi:adenosine deaminase
MKSVLKHLKPDRIGHGIRAVNCKETMAMLADSGTVLEVCPTSNLYTRAVSSLEEMQSILGQFWENDVQFTINTDGTYFCRTNLQREFTILKDAGVLNLEQLETVRLKAFEASFLP